jgi:hypothetical protein
VHSWDGDKYLETGDQISLAVEWRFVSQALLETALQRVTGEVSVTWDNPLSSNILVRVDRLLFLDANGNPMSDHEAPDSFEIAGTSQETRTGTFQIVVADLSVTERITKMELDAFAEFD